MRILSLFAALVIVSQAVSPAKAVSTSSYDLVATTNFPDVVGGFSLIFDDFDDNMLFSFNELTSFSGVVCFVCVNGFNGSILTDSYIGDEPGDVLVGIFFDEILAVPNITGFTLGSGAFWSFTIGSLFPNGSLFTLDSFNGDLFLFESFNWEYDITLIPLPAPLLLLVTALAGLFGVSRLQRKAVAA